MDRADVALRTGAWLISLGKLVASEAADEIARFEFDSVSLAYRGAMFYSSVRSLGTISTKRLEAFRKSHGLTAVEFGYVLQRLEDIGIAELRPDAKDEECRLVVKNGKREDVYRFALQLFEAQDPKNVPRIALGILDATVMLPIRRADLLQATSKLGYEERSINDALKHLEVLGALQITRETLDGEPLIYNPLYFQYKDQDAARALSALNPQERDSALQIVSHVKAKPGLPVPSYLRGKAYEVVKKAGIIDVSIFTPRRGETPHEFPTLQAAWGVLKLKDHSEAGSDIIDDAKAFLASLRYGENYATSSGGRIWNPFVLLRAMIQRGFVGPASNIGSDYPLIARRGIVDIVETPAMPGRFMMELRKPEIAEPVLQMLRSSGGTDAGSDDDVTPLELANPYRPPEESRRAILKEEIRDAWESVVHESLRIRR